MRKPPIAESAYAENWQMRRDMIWCAMTAVYSSTVKDPIAYVNRKRKVYGDILKTAVGLAYEGKNSACYAAEMDAIDEKICAAHGWRSIADLRR